MRIHSRPVATAGMAACALAGAFLSAPAQSAVLWDTYGSGYAGAFESNGVHINSEAFTLSKAAQISSIEWSGVYFPTAPTVPDNFSIGLYENEAAGPADTPFDLLTSLTTSKTLDGTLFGAYPSYDYETTFSTPISLAAGTYYISINDVGEDFYWDVVSDGGALFVQDPSYTTYPGWTSASGTVAFEILGSSVPEPATWVSLLLGFGMLGAAQRRRRAAVA
jgi:hypothetical protein